MQIPRNPRRRLRAAGVALLFALATATAAAPALTRHAVDRAAASASARTGVDIILDDVSGTPLLVRAARLNAHRDGVHVSCNDAHLQPRILDAIRGRARVDVSASRCVVSMASGPPADDRHDRAPSTEGGTHGDALAAALDAARAIIGDVTIGELELHAHAESATLRELRAERGGAEWRATTTIDVPSLGAAGRVRAWTSADSISVSTDGPLRLERLQWDGLPLRDGEIELERATLGPGGTLVIEGTDVALCPCPSAPGVGETLRVEIDSASFSGRADDRPIASVRGVRFFVPPFFAELVGSAAHLATAAGRALGANTPVATGPDPTAGDQDPTQPPPDLVGRPWATEARAALLALPSAVSTAAERLRTRWEARPIDVVADEISIAGLGMCPGMRAAVRIDADGVGGTMRCDEIAAALSWAAADGGRTEARVSGLDAARLPLAEVIGLGGTVAAAVALTPGESVDAATIAGSLSWTAGRFEFGPIAARPVTDLSVSVELELEVSPGRGADEPEISGRADLTFNGLGLDAELSVDGDALRLEAGVSEQTTCQDMFDAIPRGMVPSVAAAGVEFSGAARPRVTLTYSIGTADSIDFRTAGFMGDCVVEDIGAPYDPSILNRTRYIHTVTEGVTAPLDVGPGTDGYVSLDALPSYVPALMYLSEEIAFFSNPGFSEHLMRRALRLDVRSGRYVYGGSTVSQQLVKNLFFDRQKTLSRKLEEAIVVWRMEHVVPKIRILELYLNCIEFGPDVYGIDAAARYYFDRSPDTLTPLEAAFLAALKPAPWEGERFRRRGYSPRNEWWTTRIATLLDRLVEFGPFIDADEAAHYRPVDLTFPTSPNPDPSLPRIERPPGATVESLPAARFRLFGAVEPLR